MNRIILIATILVASFSATAQSSYSITTKPVNAYSKAIGTVEKYNTQTWTDGLLRQSGIQKFDSDFVTIEIDWQKMKIEIGHNYFDFQAITNVGVMITFIYIENHPEIGAMLIHRDTKGNYKKLSFKKN